MFRFLLAFFAILFLGISSKTAAQIITFQESILQNRNHTGYTILSDTSGGRDQYLLAGTIEEPGFADSLDLNVLYTDANGNVIWQRRYDTGDNERCLNAAHDGSGYVLTGVVDTSVTSHQLYILRIDAFGNVVDQKRYESPFPGHTHGLNVKRTSDNGYILSGFLATGYLTNSPKQSFVLKVDSLLNPLWSRYFDTPWDIHVDRDMAESLIEIPGQGYFVTGAVNIKKYAFGSPTYNWTDQGVLALMLDANGNVMWNSSFCVQDSTTTGHWNLGVKPYFDSSSNLIYLMSNNTQTHQFNITVFNLAGNIVNHWDYGFVLTGFAGYDLIESGNPNTLVACGLATFTDFTVSGTYYTSNYPPVLVEFNKSDGTMVWSKMYQVPSEYYGTFSNGFFTPIPGQQPELFTPDMAVRSLDGGYAIAGFRSNASSFFDLELIKTADNGWVDCPKVDLNFNPTLRARIISDSLTVDSGFVAAPVSFIPDTMGFSQLYCTQPDTCSCQILPAFSASTSDSCTYSFTDLTWVDSCYQACNVSWNFGDGNTSSLPNPTHNYDTTGLMTVCMNVAACDINGITVCDTMIYQNVWVDCDSCTCEIAPQFSFATSDSCTYTFTDGSALDSCFHICSWNWTFGDGSGSPSPSPSHTYSTPGMYEVCLETLGCDSVGWAVCDTTFCDSIWVPCPVITTVNPEDDLFVTIQPNPFSDQTAIQFSRSLKDAEVVLLDPLGRIVQNHRISGKNAVIRRNGLADGIYHVNIIEGGILVHSAELVIR